MPTADTPGSLSMAVVGLDGRNAELRMLHSHSSRISKQGELTTAADSSRQLQFAAPQSWRQAWLSLVYVPYLPIVVCNSPVELPQKPLPDP